MEVYTIGFTKTQASEFFGKLKRAGIQRLVDIRLNNMSQLAGFAKRDDLHYFLAEICGARYVHLPQLAPSREILDDYKKGNGAWEEFQQRFLSLMAIREVETVIDPSLFDIPTVLLCSEHTADHCHRRLVLEYLDSCWGNVRAKHL